MNSECYFTPGSQIRYKLISTARALIGPCVMVTEPGTGDSLQSGNINSGKDASTKVVRSFLALQRVRLGPRDWLPLPISSVSSQSGV